MRMASNDPAFGPGTYGRSFADVYDDWYPPDGSTGAAVQRIAELAGTGGRVLELGVGTGRLAIPLADRGLRVTGMDASEEMLDLLRAKSQRDGSPAVATALGDVGTPTDWPEGPFDVVVAAFNLVFNLTDGEAQAKCFRAASSVLAPGGALVVEAFIPAPMEHRERALEVREVAADRVVLIATDSEPSAGVVTGQHIELIDGAPVRLRPWRIRVAGVAELDGYASSAGLAVGDRYGDWAGAPYDPHGRGHVSVYRRSSTSPS